MNDSSLQEIFQKHIATLMNDPNAVGEVLREWAFVDGYGCYSTFTLIPKFEKVEPSFLEFRKIIGRPYNPSIKDSYGWGDSDDEIMKMLQWYKHPNGIEVGWYWDGDGVLCFFSPELKDNYFDGTVTNTDCKKSSGWEFGTRF